MREGGPASRRYWYPTGTSRWHRVLVGQVRVSTVVERPKARPPMAYRGRMLSSALVTRSACLWHSPQETNGAALTQ